MMMKKYHLLLITLGLFLSFSAYGQEKNKQLEIKDFYSFYPEDVSNIRWMNEGTYYSTKEKFQIVKHNIADEKDNEVLFDGKETTPSVMFSDYTFSADEQKILLQTGTSKIYRHSFTAKYYVYDRKTKEVKELSSKGRQSYATFSPNGSRVAFTRDNNLYVTDLTTGKETQITNTGKQNEIINGSCDWVYEEEFGFPKAFFWSPDGNKIGFYTFDESQVKEYNLQMWNGQKVYPDDYRFKYPKAGVQNSTITISIYDVAKAKTTKMDIGEETDMYIPRLRWTKSSDVLAIFRLNRLQNKLEILHADASSGKTKAVLTEEDPDGYVDIEYADELVYLKDGKHFINSSEKDGYKHFYLYTIDGKQVRQITKGNWEVQEYLGIDESGKTPVIYFTSSEESPLERHFYSVDIEGKKKVKLAGDKGTNGVSMSSDFKYYILKHSSAEKPLTVSLYQIKKNKRLAVLKENKELLKKTEEYNFAKKEFFDFKTKDGTKLYGYMLKPKDFDPKKKYPVLMYVYGGPSSQNVKDSWSAGHYSWHQMLTQKGYIVVSVDNRGTDARGEQFKKSTYAQLGKYETEDQIETSQYLKKLPYVDGGRVGIWGWSYGGYMASLGMTLGADHFKMGIAVAPVTTWRLYDSIYTERFLKRPSDNKSGYDDFSPINHADKLKGKLLIVHGTGDDNVHVQNTILFQDALINAGKQFDVFYYPNRAHSIGGINTRFHLYQMLTDYVVENL